MNAIQQQILEDLEDLPELMQAETLDFVQFLKAKVKTQAIQSNEENGVEIARVLKRMAERKALSEIKDPAAWQREIRRDRALPERDF